MATLGPVLLIGLGVVWFVLRSPDGASDSSSSSESRKSGKRTPTASRDTSTRSQQNTYPEDLESRAVNTGQTADSEDSTQAGQVPHSDPGSRHHGGREPARDGRNDKNKSSKKTGIMSESDSMEKAFEDLANHLENEIGREQKELQELKEARNDLKQALNDILEHERLIDLAVELEDRAFHQNDVSGMKLHQQLNQVMQEVGLNPGEEDQVLQREAALIDKVSKEVHEAAMDLEDVLSKDNEDVQESKGTLQELENVDEHLKKLEKAARSAEKALSR